MYIVCFLLKQALLGLIMNKTIRTLYGVLNNQIKFDKRILK